MAAGEPFDGRLPAAVFALLVTACFVAFFLTQHLKHTPTAVQMFKLTPRFSPTPSGHIKEERISFRLAERDEVTVVVLDSAGVEVATLVHDQPVERYKQISLRWSGRRGTPSPLRITTGSAGQPVLTPVLRGRAAPAGEYRVRVSLRRQDRTVLSPRSFTLVRP
ncbi:MAG TPA: hypothetical protein VMB05_13410 [Solirubrobacteraceae bacterium]|nr:hypothetical protein [Solirubrobacteraceae bacterium]